MPEDSPTPAREEAKRALIILAHPDDPEFGAGGTIARWTDEGVVVGYVIVTDGSKGSADPEMTPFRLVAIREEEQRAAAARLGVTEITFLGFIDGEITPDLHLRHAITREIRAFRPDIVVTHDPASLYWDNFINHPDHRAVGQATLDAIYPTARDRLNAPHLLEQGLHPHIVRQIYLTGPYQPDTYSDISATIDRKLAALREHKSQIADMDAMEKRLRDRYAGFAEGRGMAYAEIFKKIEFL